MSTGLKTALLLGALSGVLMLIGSALGGGNGLVIGFLVAVVMNVGSYWFSDKIVLRMYRAQPVGEDHLLYRVTARLAQRAGLPMPKVYIVPGEMSPNAFATGRNPEHAAVVATEGILKLLPENELEGVLAHELTHVKNRDILTSSIAATLAAAIMLLARFAFFFGGRGDDRDRGGNALTGLAMLILAPLAAGLIQMAISRQREYAADRGGAELAGTPTGLANALRRIDATVKQIPMDDANPATAHMFIMNPLTGGRLVKLFSTHPPVEERVARLERMIYGTSR